ncbi:MAG: ATP-binding protein [Campylobacterales bacterium]|nr:ATP-binding protein [Campylobacterales bacterium]
MKDFIEFINAKNPTETSLYDDLKCSKEEANLLQYLCKKYAKGIDEVLVLEVLEDNFKSEANAHLEKLDLVKNLLDLGWATLGGFANTKIADTSSKLEMLPSSISLSSSFFRLVDEMATEVDTDEIRAYTSQLEYLQDQFDKIALMQVIAGANHSAKDISAGITRFRTKLELLQQRINQRLELTSEEMPIENLFREKKLSQNEQSIFFALLKEEYSSSEGQYRELGKLVELVSCNEFEKMKNRSLLDEDSKLLSEEIIDYDEILNMFGSISRAFFINEEILTRVMNPNKKKKATKLKLETLVKEQEIFEFIEPATTLDDVVLNDKTKETLETIMRQLDKDVFEKLKQWGIKGKKRSIDAKIIFYGYAGTGKTLTAHSLARSLKKPILSFDCSKILSMYVGESEKNVRRIFDDFYDLSRQAKVDPILLLNEADQFLSSRVEGVGSGADKMHNQMQNIFLEQIEKFEGILIATTNLLGNIDKAFSRRFDYKIEFKKPNKKQRLRLWQMMLPENADYEDGFEIEPLTRYELTGAQIDLIIKNTAYKVAVREESLFGMEDFIEVINKELASNFDRDGASMGFRL